MTMSKVLYVVTASTLLICNPNVPSGFVSHVWSSGQDQAAVIKKLLLLVLPGCNIFLDVRPRCQPVPPRVPHNTH